MNRSNFICSIIWIVLITPIYGQQTAITESGDTIYVYSNGTWSFELEDDEIEVVNELAYLDEELKIDTATTVVVYSPDANKEVVNAFELFKIKYNDKMWKRIPPASINDEAEFAFQSKKSDVWCVVISEETSIEIEKLYLIAKNTLEENVGGAVNERKLESINVNGKDVIHAVVDADFSGIPFTFDTYYYSGANGSVQFTTWTGRNVWKKNKEDIQQLLNGFIPN